MTNTNRTNIITHTFNTFPVRVVQMDGQPWFIGSDIRRVLGVQQSGSNYSCLNNDEVQLIPRGLASGKGMGRAQIVSESGLYKLIMRSDKPQARAFQDWVTRDVLPAIRKDGAYVMGEEKVAAGERIPMTNAMTTTLHNHNAFYNEVVCADPLTMSSREIAELTGKLHKNVLADTRKMLVELG